MKTAFLLCFTFFCQWIYAQNGGIKGKVTGKDGEPLIGALVTLEHTSFRAVTDSEGRFSFQNVPPGEYIVVMESVGYGTANRHIKLKEGETEKVNTELEPRTTELQEVSVYGKLSQEEDAGARNREKRSDNIVNVVSARAMERSPDINAANVLQRVSGVTVLRNGGGDEAYADVRGMQPQYNNTLIDGIKIASPDDKSRTISMSLVPSDLLGSIEVHKTLLPEMEGDAIGGTVNLVMKDAPQKETFKVLGSLGYSTIVFNQPFDYFSRKDIQQKSPTERYGDSYVAQPGDFSRTNLEYHPITPPPTGTATIAYGNRYMHNKLGLLVVESFQNQYYGNYNNFAQVGPAYNANGAPQITDFANRWYSTQQLNEGITAHLDYIINPRNKITLNNMALYSFLGQARTEVDTAIVGGNGGRTVPGTGPVTTDWTSVTQRTYMENLKLAGKHVLSQHFLLDWTGVYSLAFARAPDMADLQVNDLIDSVHSANGTYGYNGTYGFQKTPNYFDAISRVWQHNRDQDFDVMANLSYKTSLPGRGILELKGGGLYRAKVRYNLQNSYTLKPDTDAMGIKQVFIDVQSARWTVFDPKGSYDYDVNNYRAYEDIAAGYGEFKFSFSWLDVLGGVRVENTQQGFTINNFHVGSINEVHKTYTDPLPSLDLKFKLNPKTNLRASYYKSIARPAYYDLVPTQVLNFAAGTATEGNDTLKHTIADNYDLRFEYYPREEEALQAGVFYKHLINTIEQQSSDGVNYRISNVPEAHVYGAELSYTRYFGKFGLTGNYTYLNSRTVTSKQYYHLNPPYQQPDSLVPRPLQGMTDHTVNLSAMYRNPKRGTFVQLAFQYLGSSLSNVYNIVGWDYYQRPTANLALSAEQQLRNRHLTLFTKWNNLTNSSVRSQIKGHSDMDLSKEVTGLSFSFGLRYEH